MGLGDRSPPSAPIFNKGKVSERQKGNVAYKPLVGLLAKSHII